MGATNDPTTKPKPKGPRERSIPLSPNGHTARFLYLMLKQVDVKHIKWQEVADGTGISRGQVAKARYGRFKKQIESQILGDAIQVKREREMDVEQEDEKGLVKGIGGSPLKRGQDRDGTDDEEDEHVNVMKRVKIEDGNRVKRKCGLASSIVSVDDDSDDEESTASSQPRTPLVKSEIDLDDGLPRFPIFKSEPLENTSAFRRHVPIVSATPLRRQSSNCRSPWVASGTDEGQVVLSACPARLEPRDNPRGTGKGSAQEPFSID